MEERRGSSKTAVGAGCRNDSEEFSRVKVIADTFMWRFFSCLPAVLAHIVPKWLRGQLPALLFRRSDLPIQVRQDNLANHVLVLLLRYFQIFEKLSEMITRSKQSFSALV
jgi:hypothetical protein